MKLSKIVCSILLATTSNMLLAADKEQPVALNDIIITGSKLDKSLQETTTSVQVFDEVSITNSSKMEDMYDIFEQTSNVSRTDAYNFSIRGISSQGITGTAVGPRAIDINVDGASQGMNAAKEDGISTWDVEQIEILKGPQSTTQGRNSLAGAVILKTKDPEFEANGAAKVGYASNNTRSLAVMQTGPITDNLAFRITAEKKHTDGYITNDQLGKDDFNEDDILKLRGKLLYNFENGATALLTLSKLDLDDDGSHVVYGNPYDRKSNWNMDGFYNTDSKSHSLEVKYPINNKWSFKSVTALTKDNFHRLSDFDALSGDTYSDIHRDAENTSQEFRFTYNDDRLDAIVGLYYLDGKGTDDQKADNVDVSSIFKVTGLTINYVQDLQEDYKNKAVFFNTDYKLNEEFTIIAGARLDKDERKNANKLTLDRVPDYGTSINAAIDAKLSALAGDITSDTDTSNFLPKLGFNYKWNKNINTGLVYSKGYRPGGITSNPVQGASKTFDAEYTDNIEASFRSQWLDKRLTVNANVFYTKWKDQQVDETGSTGSAFDYYIVNAGKSDIKGLEIESRYELNAEVDLHANVGYQKAEFKEYTSGSTDYRGKEILKTPNITANLGANYRDDKGYFTGGNISYTGKQYADNENTRQLSSFTTVNVKTGYEQEAWALYFYINNLFDRDYLLNNYSDGTYETGEPRMLGFNYTYNW